MNEFQPLEELRIGKIIEVSGTSIKIEIDSNIDDLLKIYNGKVYPIGQVASIVKVLFGRRILFGHVNLLKMKSDYLEELGKIKFSEDARIIECELFAEGVWNLKDEHLTLNLGIETYPLPQQYSFLMTQNELDHLYKCVEDNFIEGNSPYIKIGTYCGSVQECSINIDKMFCQHCAILGSTGSGKSGTVAAILHSVLDYEYANKKLFPNIVLIDPHGEYEKAFGDSCKTYKAYSTPGQEEVERNDHDLVMPYWVMSSGEFRELVVGKTEFEATSQNNIVYEALRYARLAHAGVIKRFDNNVLGRSEFILEDEKTQSDVENFDRDKPVPFLLSDFIFHMDLVQGRKAGQTEKASVSDRKEIDGVLRKLKVLQANPQLSFLMKEYGGDVSLVEILKQFISYTYASAELKIIDTSGIPNEVAGILTAMIARLLFQFKLWENRSQREQNPILLVCEEAHRYVPNNGEAQYKEAQNAIRRVAKEGRKYGIGLMLISQRPSDVESTVLSQCNTWVVLRLTNSNDKNYISNFMPDNNLGLVRNLSSLTRREAIIVGEAISMPCRVRIRELQESQLPDSGDISFINGWINTENNQEQIVNEVITNWVSVN